MYEIPVRIENMSGTNSSTTAQVDRQQKGTINFRRCSEKDTIYISEPKQRKTYNKKIRCIFRSQNTQKLRLFDTVRLLGFCWYPVTVTLQEGVRLNQGLIEFFVDHCLPIAQSAHEKRIFNGATSSASSRVSRTRASSERGGTPK